MATSTPSASSSAVTFEDFCAKNSTLSQKLMRSQNIQKTKTERKRCRGLGKSEVRTHGETLLKGSDSESVMDLNSSLSDAEISAKKQILNKSQTQSGVVNKNVQLIPNEKAANTASESTNYYPKDFTGKAFVLVDSSECELFKNTKIRNGMTLYQHIRHLQIKDIELIEAVGVTLYKITFSNPQAANYLVKNKELLKMKLKPFIPRTAFETYGVIRGVALYLSDEEILKGIDSSVQVNFVQRFRRKDQDDPMKLIPTYTVKLGFLGNNIPKEVKIEYTKFNVDHYFPPVRQCLNCGRLGHTQKGCRSNKRCLLCGAADICVPSCQKRHCILCKSDEHKSSDKQSCPVWVKENEINQLKTIKKLSRKEVLNTYYPIQSNRFSLLDVEESEFPPLVEKENCINNDAAANRKLLKKKFNSVAKQGAIPKANTTQPPSNSKKVAKSAVTPVFNRDDYHISSRLERAYAELLKFVKSIAEKLNDSQALVQIANLSSMKDQILAERDTLQLKNRTIPCESLNEVPSIQLSVS